MMHTKLYHLSVLLITALTLLVSCQKEIDGTIVGGGGSGSGGGGGGTPPANQYPKVGTTWTYRYNWWNSAGGFQYDKIIYHKAKSEETLGGEKWLKIVDVETDTTVYYLNTKTDGLYQYTNSNPYLLCKYPAAVNDTYNTFNEGSTESFTVTGVNDTIPTVIGNIPVNTCEGVKNATLIDIIRYNKNAWIVRKYQFKKVGLPPFQVYYLAKQMFIENIVY